MGIDWGKIIGSAIAAGLIAFQLGMDGRLEKHEEITQRNVERLENTTVHASTIAADNRLIENRLLKLERQMNSLYTDLDNKND